MKKINQGLKKNLTLKMFGFIFRLKENFPPRREGLIRKISLLNYFKKKF